MGLFGKKPADHTSLSEAEQLGIDPRQLAKMSRKERDELQRKANGTPKKRGDFSAGISDFRQGRKGSQGGVVKGSAKSNKPLNKDGSERSSWW